ncbi:MAG: 7TM-DISM domain-containing protein [Bacteroidia bacterium]
MAYTEIFLYAFEAILAFQLVYIIFQYFFIRRLEYVWYAAYIAGILFYTSLMYEQIPFRHHLDKVLPILSYIFYYRFASSFLELDIIAPTIRKWIGRLEKALFLYILADLLWKMAGQDTVAGEIAFQFIAGFLFLTTTILIISFLKTKPAYAIYIVTGAIIISLGSFGTMILIVMQQNGIDINFDPLLINNASVTVELVVFTSGLANKSRRIEIEKTILSRQYARELENNLKLDTELNVIKQKIAEEIHLELGEGISNISVYASLAEKHASEENIRLRDNLIKIRKLALEIHAILQDLSWTLNFRNTEEIYLIEKFRQIEREELIPVNLRLQVTYMEENATRKLPVSFCRVAINAIRKAINIVVQEQSDALEVLLNNDGITFSINNPDLPPEYLNEKYGNQNVLWQTDSQKIHCRIELTNFRY